MFIIPSLLQNLPVIGTLPTMIGGVLIVICCIILLNSNKLMGWLIIIYLVLTNIITIINSNNIILNIKDAIYFNTFVLISLVLSKKNVYLFLDIYFKKKKKLFFYIICMSNFILLLGLFNNSAYYYDWDDYGIYYKGFTYMPHVVAALCLLLLLINLYYIYNINKGKKSLHIMLIIPIYCIMKTGARVYLVPLLLLLLLVVVKKYGYKKGSILLFVSLPLIVSAIMSSSMLDKFISVFNFEFNNNLLSNLTSGRSQMWSGLIYHYSNNYNVIEKIVGTSYDNVYRLNYLYSGMNVWAHNDIINILISMGIIGVVIYIYCFYNYYKAGSKKNRQKDVTIIFFTIFVFLAAINGLYMQIACIFCIPFYWLVFEYTSIDL